MKSLRGKIFALLGASMVFQMGGCSITDVTVGLRAPATDTFSAAVPGNQVCQYHRLSLDLAKSLKSPRP